MKINKQLLYIFLMLFIYGINSIQAAKIKKGYDIMKKVRDQTRIHKTQDSEVVMVIKNKKGQERNRKFNHLKKVEDGLTSGLIKFFQPASVKGTGLLTTSNDEDDESQQWIYLPAFRSIKKLTSGDKNDRFMGSDFSVGDMGGRNLNQDNHQLIKETKKYYYISSLAKDKEDQYSKIASIISKKIYVPIQASFYDKKNKLIKVMKNTKIKKVKGMYVVTLSTMYNKQTGGETVLQVDNVKVGLDIPNNAISVSSLKN